MLKVRFVVGCAALARLQLELAAEEFAERTSQNRGQHDEVANHRGGEQRHHEIAESLGRREWTQREG